MENGSLKRIILHARSPCQGADKDTSLRFTSRTKTQNLPIYTQHPTPTLHQHQHQPQQQHTHAPTMPDPSNNLAPHQRTLTRHQQTPQPIHQPHPIHTHLQTHTTPMPPKTPTPRANETPAQSTSDTHTTNHTPHAQASPSTKTTAPAPLRPQTPLNYTATDTETPPQQSPPADPLAQDITTLTHAPDAPTTDESVAIGYSSAVLCRLGVIIVDGIYPKRRFFVPDQCTIIRVGVGGAMFKSHCKDTYNRTWREGEAVVPRKQEVGYRHRIPALQEARRHGHPLWD